MLAVCQLLGASALWESIQAVALTLLTVLQGISIVSEASH